MISLRDYQRGKGRRSFAPNASNKRGDKLESWVEKCMKIRHKKKKVLDDIETDDFRSSVLGRVIIVFTIQALLSILIMYEAIVNYGKKDTNQITEWRATWIIMARFIVGIVMHVNLGDRVQQGMRMMKYSVNHKWKFDDWKYGFIAGLMQFVSNVCVETANWTSILTHYEIMDIVMKFMSLLIIATFG